MVLSCCQGWEKPSGLPQGQPAQLGPRTKTSSHRTMRHTLAMHCAHATPHTPHTLHTTVRTAHTTHHTFLRQHIHTQHTPHSHIYTHTRLIPHTEHTLTHITHTTYTSHSTCHIPYSHTHTHTQHSTQTSHERKIQTHHTLHTHTHTHTPHTTHTFTHTHSLLSAWANAAFMKEKNFFYIQRTEWTYLKHAAFNYWIYAVYFLLNFLFRLCPAHFPNGIFASKKENYLDEVL